MKKKVILLAAMFAGATTFAQDLTSKKGEAILPEAGDWAIQLDASPFLNFAGNLFNSGATAPGASWLNTSVNYIAGKYFVDASTAYRARFGVAFKSSSVTTPVTDVSPGAAAGATVDNKTTVSGTPIVLGGGIEMRKGSTRLQGYYGGELMLWLAGPGKTKNEYGNSMENDFNANGTAARVTEVKGGSTFGLGIVGILGVEYFLAPKISIGAEYSWGINFRSTGAVTTTTETWDAVNNTAKSTEVTGGKNSAFGIGAGLGAGGTASQLGNTSLVATFHF